ncbi:hypothetical protein PBY51_018568 [Eleginops maclovinus]|uniref:Uncharacterized protein n=1 Tax=Eleginops maclovinus TaxID=56733 RepID=A0AAN8AYA8_ELEMC|nr:hypothetical protein PBY51_018568 [Eleginops maclovinus]
MATHDKPSIQSRGDEQAEDGDTKSVISSRHSRGPLQYGSSMSGAGAPSVSNKGSIQRRQLRHMEGESD